MNYKKNDSMYYLAILIAILIVSTISQPRLSMAKELDFQIKPNIITIDAFSTNQNLEANIVLKNFSTKDELVLKRSIASFKIDKNGKIENQDITSKDMSFFLKNISFSDNSDSNIILSPKQEKNITLMINNIDKSLKGSEYNFSVIFTSSSSSTTTFSSKQQKVPEAKANIELSIPVHVLVRMNKDNNSGIFIKDTNIQPIQLNKDLSSKIIIDNQNSTTAIIYTNISIYNLLSNKIINKNLDSKLIPPKTSRDIMNNSLVEKSEELISLDGLIPGVYKLKVDFTADGRPLKTEYKTFIYIDLKTVIAISLISLLIKLIINRSKK